MKYIYLLRHAKSSWDDASLADFDRPLNDRGLRTAPFVGGLMAEKGIQPDVIVSSPAKRAAQTAEMVLQASGGASRLQFDMRIYEAGPGALLDVISELPDKAGSAMLVGHNPGMEAIVSLLTRDGGPMPTAALAAVKLSVERWADAGPGTGELEFLLRPKDEMRKQKAAGSDADGLQN